MEVPELRVENRPVSDPANAHRRNQPSSTNQRQHTLQHLPPRSRPPLPQEAPSLGPVSAEQRLNFRLRTELPCYVGTNWQIAQPQILRDILTTEEILSLLKEYQADGRLSKNENVEALCRKVRGHGHPRCVVVLAMLILVDRGSTIGEVLRDQLFDDHLPILANNHENPVLYLWDQPGESWRRLRCFENYRVWGVQAKLDICKWQWLLRVPHMTVLGPTFQAYENKFGPDTVLPWSSKTKDGEVMRHDRTEGFGAYSAIYRIHIDDRFHGFHDVMEKIGLAGGRGFFALKVLNIYTPDERAMVNRLFENEKQQLNRFSGVANNHLVTLLAAFEQENVDKNFFVFPWAECDLFDYWANEQPPDFKWISKQLEGLVSALDEIHNPSQSRLGIEPRVFGRHGDLKPDNILWFTPYRGDAKGILVISDMGFTAVNSELSRSKQTNGKPRTPTYRPPELDIPGAFVTREYDVWSLGCIFLEMITWLLGGHGLNKDFKSQRMTIEYTGVRTPVFFTFVEGQPIVKPEVTEWIRSLRSHERSTEFIHAVLDVVQNKMIVPRADRRSRVRALKADFARINERCQERHSYYMDSYNAPSKEVSGVSNIGADANQASKQDIIISQDDDKSSRAANSTSGPEPTESPGTTSFLEPVELFDAAESHVVTEAAALTTPFELTEPLESAEAPESTESPVSIGRYESKGPSTSSEGPVIAETYEYTGTSHQIEVSESKGSMKSTDKVFTSVHESNPTMSTVPTNPKPIEVETRDSDDGSTSDSDADTKTIYAGSNASVGSRNTYVEHFAEILFDKVASNASSFESLERAVSALSDNIKGFATRLGLNTTERTQLAIVHFTHQYRNEIKCEFENLLQKKRKESEQVTWKEKKDPTRLWVNSQDHSPYEPPDIPPIEDSPPDPDEWQHDENRRQHIGLDFLSGSRHVLDGKTPSLNPKTADEFIKFHDDRVVETAAYSWLVETLRRDILLQPVADTQNHMQTIKGKIRKYLRTRKIDKRSSSKLFKVNFLLDWEPWTFLKEQEPCNGSEEVLPGAVTFTGSPGDAQALTCLDYLIQTWPTNGKGMMQFLVKFMKLNLGSQRNECSGTLPDGTELTAIPPDGKRIDWERIIVHVTGVSDAVAEVGQQLAWIGAALRSAPEDSKQGLCECYPTITREQMQSKKGDTRTFGVKFKLHSPMDPANTRGSCWHSMLRNPVIVTGFPIRWKTAREFGIEMPLEIMAHLSGSRRARIFDGKVVLKGFATMLSVVKQVGDFLIWHYKFHSDGSRIPFFEAPASEMDIVSLGMLNTHRHIIGWCSSAKYYAGAPKANHHIEGSGLPRPGNDNILDKVSLSGGKWISFGIGVSISVKNRPLHLVRGTYNKTLRFFEQQYVVLWDVTDQRGWLVNGTSALLHLVRIRLKHLKSKKFTEIILDLSKIKEATNGYHPTESAFEVLSHKENKQLSVEIGPSERYTEIKMMPAEEGTPTTKTRDRLFEDFVEDDMDYLQQVIDYQVQYAGKNGINLKGHVRRELEGWDFADFVNDRDPSPRLLKLGNSGWGWVDFIRYINAVTLFGRGFGDLIQPEEPNGLCQGWQTVPKNQYYLAANATDLMAIREVHGNKHDHPAMLVHGVYWHTPDACSCGGVESSEAKHKIPVQMLWPPTWKHFRTIKGPNRLDQNQTAAFIFGHNASDPLRHLRWPNRGTELTEIVQDGEDSSSEIPDRTISNSPESSLQLAIEHSQELGNSRPVDTSTSANYGLDSSVQVNESSVSSREPPTPILMTNLKDLTPREDASANRENHQTSIAGPLQEAERPARTVSIPPTDSVPLKGGGRIMELFTLSGLKKKMRHMPQIQKSRVPSSESNHSWRLWPKSDAEKKRGGIP